MTTKRSYLFLQATVMLSLYFAETLLAYATMPLCLEVLMLMLSQSLPLFFILILLFVGGSLDYQKELLIFIRPLQATVMLSLYFAETLLAYAAMPLCLEVLMLMLSQSLPLFFILTLLFVGGSLDYHWTKLITYYMYFLTNTYM